jgi:peptidoglycan/LPS O-acetylase OafA/YrhL
MSVSAMSAPANPPQAPVRRLEGLDGLRGIAALCVLWFHAVGVLHPEWHLEARGYLAVDFFFMLSGYVMARTYERRFAEGYRAHRFLIARYRKLWPFMALGALIGAPILGQLLDDPARALGIAAANAALIPAFSGGWAYPVNIAAWSILAELTANLIHAAVLWRLPSRILALVALAMVPLLGWIAAVYGSLAVGAESATVLAGIVRALLPYGLGILLWRLWRDRPGVRINPALAFAAMPVLILLVPNLLGLNWAYDMAFALFACPLLMAGGLAWHGSSRILRWIGQISFPLYAINLPILLWAKGLGLGALVGVAASLALASYLALRPGGRPAAKAAAATA